MDDESGVFLGPKLSEVCLSQGKYYLVGGGVCEEVASGCGTGTCSCRGSCNGCCILICSDGDLRDVFSLKWLPHCCVDLILGRQVLSFSGSMLSGICWSHYQLLGVFVKKLGLGVELEFAQAMVAAVWVFSNDRPENFVLNVYSILWIARVELSFFGPKLSVICWISQGNYSSRWGSL